MKLDWGRWAARARSAVWSLAVAALAAVLVLQALRARREAADLRARGAALDLEIRRLRGANQGLRDEVQALEADPVYLEALLRSWKMAGADERPAEPGRTGE